MVSQRTRRFSEKESREGGMMGQMSEAARHPGEVVAHYPISTSLVVFGVGIGVGIVVAQVLCGPIEQAFHEPTRSERWGRSMQDAMHQYMPELSRRMGV
jgi:hypothetical protein